MRPINYTFYPVNSSSFGLDLDFSNILNDTAFMSYYNSLSPYNNIIVKLHSSQYASLHGELRLPGTYINTINARKIYGMPVILDKLSLNFPDLGTKKDEEDVKIAIIYGDYHGDLSMSVKDWKKINQYKNPLKKEEPKKKETEEEKQKIEKEIQELKDRLQKLQIDLDNLTRQS